MIALARLTVDRWRRGIGFRVSFLMTAVLVMVTTLVGAYFFWEEKKSYDAEVRVRALYVANEAAASTAEDIAAGNRNALDKKISSYFTSSEELLSGTPLLSLTAYDRNCDILASSTATALLSRIKLSANPRLSCDSQQGPGPIFLVGQSGLYELTLPVLNRGERAGFLRVGVYGQPLSRQFAGTIQKIGVALFGILLVGIAFGRIIALGITRPILQLSEAADKLSRQNWDTPLPLKGFDEISKLSRAFNRMVLALKEREASLSRGNRDLFILHTSGLDLMESLDLDALLAKIAARAEDLVRADTTAISVIGGSDRMLKYLGVFGTKSKLVKERDLPLEAGGIYNWLVSYGTPLLITDAQDDFRLDSGLMKTLGINSIMAVPLWQSNTMTGILTVLNKKGGVSFDKNDLRLFTVFSSLSAAALQNASLYSDLKAKMNELKLTQEQLIHSTKMAAIGELAANVAHEINNPLTSVLGYTTHLLKTLPLQESPRRILGMMEQETLRVRKIIRNLLDFARHKPSSMQPGDLAIPLRETVALVQGVADAASVVIQEDYPPASLAVNMDQNEMKQVFINIVNNALQAMPRGGELRIRLDRVNDQELVVEFSDTGTGIAPENVDKIFEPFFSTKSSGDGTGLGLSISYRIVRNHGGRIETKSEAGKGTVFSVFLPSYQSG